MELMLAHWLVHLGKLRVFKKKPPKFRIFFAIFFNCLNNASRRPHGKRAWDFHSESEFEKNIVFTVVFNLLELFWKFRKLLENYSFFELCSELHQSIKLFMF